MTEFDLNVHQIKMFLIIVGLSEAMHNSTWQLERMQIDWVAFFTIPVSTNPLRDRRIY